MTLNRVSSSNSSLMIADENLDLSLFRKWLSISLYLRYTRRASSCSLSSLINLDFEGLLSSGSISEGYRVKKLSSIVLPLLVISLKINSLTVESCWFFVSDEIMLVNSMSIWIWLARRFTNEVYSGGK